MSANPKYCGPPRIFTARCGDDPADRLCAEVRGESFGGGIRFTLQGEGGDQFVVLAKRDARKLRDWLIEHLGAP